MGEVPKERPIRTLRRCKYRGIVCRSPQIGTKIYIEALKIGGMDGRGPQRETNTYIEAL
jgi:hypothetical protein